MWAATLALVSALAATAGLTADKPDFRLEPQAHRDLASWLLLCDAVVMAEPSTEPPRAPEPMQTERWRLLRVLHEKARAEHPPLEVDAEIVVGSANRPRYRRLLDETTDPRVLFLERTGSTYAILGERARPLRHPDAYRWSAGRPDFGLGRSREEEALADERMPLARFERDLEVARSRVARLNAALAETAPEKRRGQLLALIEPLDRPGGVVADLHWRRISRLQDLVGTAALNALLNQGDRRGALDVASRLHLWIAGGLPWIHPRKVDLIQSALDDTFTDDQRSAALFLLEPHRLPAAELKKLTPLARSTNLRLKHATLRVWSEALRVMDLNPSLPRSKGREHVAQWILDTWRNDADPMTKALVLRSLVDRPNTELTTGAPRHWMITGFETLTPRRFELHSISNLPRAFNTHEIVVARDGAVIHREDLHQAAARAPSHARFIMNGQTNWQIVEFEAPLPPGQYAAWIECGNVASPPTRLVVPVE